MSEQAMKHDQGKPMMDLLYGGFLIGISKVLTFGAKKYSSWNWAKGMPYSKAYAALLRHLTAWHMGEDLDPETGLSHLDHAGCELMFLRGMIDHRPDMDDRFRWKQIIPETEALKEKHTKFEQALAQGYKHLEEKGAV